MHWVVLRTKPRSELWAAENVARQGVEYYLPRLAPERGTAPPPLFPGYLFARIIGQWRFLRSTFGVLDLVMQGESPAELRAAEIEWIRSLEGEDGLVRLPEPPVPEPLRAGERLRVEHGPFAGLRAICGGMKSTDRVYILLDVLGKQTRTDIPLRDVSRD